MAEDADAGAGRGDFGIAAEAVDQCLSFGVQIASVGITHVIHIDTADAIAAGEDETNAAELAL